MLTCREASVLISEARDRKLRLHERLGLRVHLWMCISCRRFNRQVRLMCRLLRSQTGPDLFDTPGPGLADEARERIRQAMAGQGKSRE